LLKNSEKVILASNSKRRLALLKNLGLSNIERISHNINEDSFLDVRKIEKSAKIIAYQKALNVRNKLKNKCIESIIIAGDTIVYRAGLVFQKADSKEKVKHYLKLLSSKKHFVYGGICIISKTGNIFSRLSKTEVYFEKLNNSDFSEEILKEGIGKSGGYAIQGFASRFIKKIKGSYTNVVGISIPEVYKILKVI